MDNPVSQTYYWLRPAVVKAPRKKYVKTTTPEERLAKLKKTADKYAMYGPSGARINPRFRPKKTRVAALRTGRHEFRPAAEERNAGRKTGTVGGFNAKTSYRMDRIARELGRDLVAKAEAHGIMSFTPDEKGQHARTAMEFAVGVVKAEIHPVATRLSAAKTVLEYTMEKPASKQEHTISKAEDWLKSLAELDDKSKE